MASSWNLDKIRKDRRELAEKNLAGASREELLDRIAEVEMNLYVMTYTWSELDIVPSWRCNAWVTSNLFPCRGDDDTKVLTIDQTQEPKVDYRDVPPIEKWHETEFCSEESLSIEDGSKIHDDFELISVHQNAPGAYVGCGNIKMGDVRRATELLWPMPQSTSTVSSNTRGSEQ